MKSFINDDKFNLAVLKALETCSICPRNCHINRLTGEKGYCRCDASFNISSISLHHGEEPVISGKSGICNIFFSHCNLQCNFCQNYQISNNSSSGNNTGQGISDIIKKIKLFLDSGSHAVGFVSSSHLIPQMKIIINSLKINGFSPAFVFNTNAYDKPGIIDELQGLINVYLPDYKYSDAELAEKYSGASDYPGVALKSIQAMYRQTGSNLVTDSHGNAIEGLIIRHLVLPGHPENSYGVLKSIAEHISPEIHISLMSQFYPTSHVSKISPLNRKVELGEYMKVTKYMENLGMYNGWIQEPESSGDYLPDFNKTNPFE